MKAILVRIPIKMRLSVNLNYFQQELREDLIVLERLNQSKLAHPDIVARGITQLVFNMGAKVIDLPDRTTQRSCRANHDHDSYDLGRCSSFRRSTDSLKN